MIRNDTYCIYKGKEYRCVNKSDDICKIITHNKDNADATFTYYEDGIYYKNVNLSEIDEMYSIRTYGVYNGDVFRIRHEEGENYEITTSDVELARENNMKVLDKYQFTKVVPKSEVYVFEEKELTL